MRLIHRQIVSALIFSKDAKLFMGKKDPQGGGVYADCWHIPGGGVDENETRNQALIREIKEELGLDISKDSIELVDDIGKGQAEKTLQTGERIMTKMDFYIYELILPDNSNQIKINLESDLIEYNWFSLSELPEVKLTPPSITLFKRLGYL